MKYKKLLLLSVAVFSLSACSTNSKSNNSSTGGNQPDSSVSQEKSVSSQVAENKAGEVKNIDENVSYNGSYYSVKGKYDEILVVNQYSGFRSYDTQTELYQNYVNQDGKAAADRYSARPGYSEHQTGLAFDLIDKNGNLVQEAGASQWLLDNAYKYGFIVRYLEGKEGSTGYMPESWHLRYIGQEAKEIAQSGKSLEEYFGITGGGYEDQ